MLTINQKKELFGKLENVLNTYNDGEFTQCTISIDLNDTAALAGEKAILVETQYELSYTFRGGDC